MNSETRKGQLFVVGPPGWSGFRRKAMKREMGIGIPGVAGRRRREGAAVLELNGDSAMGRCAISGDGL